MTIQKRREEILREMLERLPADYDKSEGGLFYDNLAPISVEMEGLLRKMEFIFKNSYAETATGIYLDYKCKEVGIYRNQATKATGQVTIQGNVGVVVAKGTQVASDTYIYLTTEEAVVGGAGSVEVTVEAQEAGSAYNVPEGAVDTFPVTIQGLQSVSNAAWIEGGYDAESDDDLRERYYFKVRTNITSGNKAHYKKWCEEVDGVGGAKIFDLWAGDGTVKCVIADKEIEVAPEELLERVRTHVEEVRPIGATVTVVSATNKPINITATVILDENIDLKGVQEKYEEISNRYLKEIAFDQTYVSYAKLGSLLLTIAGVRDYELLKVNNGIVNVDLQEVEVPKLTSVKLVEGKE